MLKEFVKTFGKFTVRVEIDTMKFSDSKIEFYDSRYTKGFEDTRCGCQFITEYRLPDILMAFARIKDGKGDHFELYGDIPEWHLNKKEIDGCFWWLCEKRMQCI